MSVADEMAILLGWAARGVTLVAPPSREATIKEVWRVSGEMFNYDRGKMHVEHDLGAIEPVDFELIRYGNVMVVEAEGVIVQRMPIID